MDIGMPKDVSKDTIVSCFTVDNGNGRILRENCTSLPMYIVSHHS